MKTDKAWNITMNVVVVVSVFLRKAGRRTETLALMLMTSAVIVIIAMVTSNLTLLLIGLSSYIICLSILMFQTYRKRKRPEKVIEKKIRRR